ncbi:MAG: UDP-glucose 4-epimerase GalE [Bacteriovoracaceae bacterium]
MRILVTGGAGYIGSHAVKELIEEGHKVIVLDNLSKGHQEAIDSKAQFIVGSTSNLELLTQRLKVHKIEAVMHFAADIEVAESMENPQKYYQNNVTNTLTLLSAMKVSGVKKIVFSSTASVYGNPEQNPIREEHNCFPINPYGRSKMMAELMIQDFCNAYGIGYAILRYFNVAGASPDGKIGEDHHPESHLIPKILIAARDKKSIKIFGTDYPTPDGTCIRDYVHVIDLVRAHILALDAIKEREGQIYNIGSEKGFSVREVIAACEKVTKQKIKTEETKRREGDTAILVASSAKIRRELNWEPEYPSIETIVEHAWKWHTSHPKGYEPQVPSRDMSNFH